MMKKIALLKSIRLAAVLTLSMLTPLLNFADTKSVCDIYKSNGGGYSTTLTSVVCNQADLSHTITLRVEHNGCDGPSCPAMSRFCVQAAAGTYSNIVVNIQYGGMTFTGINPGPVLPGDPWNGFRIEGISGIGNGNVGVFTISYKLTGPLQDQQVSARAGALLQLASFTSAEFQSVMNCYSSDCSGGGLTGPSANNDNTTTPQNTPITLNVLANDVAGSGALVPSSVSFVSGTQPNPATVGTFTINHVTGAVTFTPLAGFTGIASIQYTVCDINSLCSSAIITVTVSSGGSDTDGDGCTDDVDDYPNDPTRCFDNYFPASGNGTLAYEDLWPSKGDYDMNDVVVDYRFKTVTDHNNKVVEIFGTFILKASGASFHNGFGFQIPTNNVDPANMTVSGYNLSHSIVSLNSHGLENSQTKPTIIIFDDFFSLMPNPGGCTGVNTSVGCEYVAPVTITIHITFNSPIYTMAQTNIENFNPFIFVGLDRTREVHLPDYTPTNLANQALFGTHDDNTNPSANKYYKTSNNLPWAINIYESFAYPKEKVDIINTYNHFVDWVTSSGLLYQDWYMDKPGYRNTSNIYTH